MSSLSLKSSTNATGNRDTTENSKEMQLVVRALRFRSSMNEMIREAQSEDEICRKACQIAINTAGYRMAWLGLAENNGEKRVTPICHAGHEDGYLSQSHFSWSNFAWGQGPTGTAIRTNQPVICSDISTDPKMEPWRKEAVKRNYLSSIALPLNVEKHTIGAFSLYGSSPNSFPTEEVRLLVEVAKDIAYAIHAQRVAKELQKAKEEAEAAHRLKSQFLDISAHELRTPITAFSLGVQLCRSQLDRGLPIDPRTFRILEKQTLQLQRIVNDLLNTSRLERGVQTLNLKSEDIVGTISELVTQAKMRSPNRKIEFQGPTQAISVQVDLLRIEQVINNLLDNAVKYSPESGPIEVSAEKISNKVRISVTDHGLGIPAEKHPFIFSRFFRGSTDDTIRNSGLGLGLFICRGIVELHGGTIGFRSQENQGTTFFFELPIPTGENRDYVESPVS